MEIRHADGKREPVESLDEAIEILENLYPDVVFGEWDPIGIEGGRMLVWEDETSAGVLGSGDDGSHAIAEIVE